MAPAVQLSFSLRTSSSIKSVHLIGSWDNYSRQLPLSANEKPGAWKGTFRFQGSQALELGKRYWYYYIVDGFQVTHDPTKEHTVERTTGRKLNILDVPGGKTTSSSATKKSSTNGPSKPMPTTTSAHKRYDSMDIPVGRGLSPSRIQCPKPEKPYASRGLREADYEHSSIGDLENRLSAQLRISPRSYNYGSGSDISDDSSASGEVFSSDSGSSTPSSCSSVGPGCRCERYGITKDGRKVRLDCAGRRCGYGDSSSECDSSGSSEDEREVARRAMRANVSGKVKPAGSGKSKGSAKVSVSSRRR